MPERELLIVTLAAGKGVRMRSALPKVLHPIGGRSMLAHVLATRAGAARNRLPWWWGPGRLGVAVRAEAVAAAPASRFTSSPQQLGTADAVLAARARCERQQGDVLVVFADTPLVEAATLRRMIEALDAGAHVAVLGFRGRPIPPATVALIVDAPAA